MKAGKETGRSRNPRNQPWNKRAEQFRPDSLPVLQAAAEGARRRTAAGSTPPEVHRSDGLLFRHGFRKGASRQGDAASKTDGYTLINEQRIRAESGGRS